MFVQLPGHKDTGFKQGQTASAISLSQMSKATDHLRLEQMQREMSAFKPLSQFGQCVQAIRTFQTLYLVCAALAYHVVMLDSSIQSDAT